MPRYFTAAEDAMVLRLPAAEVHRLTGRSLKAIGVRRIRLKRMGFPVKDQRANPAWTPAADELVRTLDPKDVAKQLGVSITTARRRRLVLGMPPVGRRRKPPRTMPKLVKRKWTADEVAIALALPPRVAVTRLSGRTPSAIHTVRCLRKRNGAKSGRTK